MLNIKRLNITIIIKLIFIRMTFLRFKKIKNLYNYILEYYIVVDKNEFSFLH